MFTTDIGWGFETSIGRVLRTSDGALHWKDITPPEANPSSTTAVFFLDQNQGWLIIPPPVTENPEPIPASVWYTTDGGGTWTSGRSFSYVGENQGGDLTFVDAQHGWYRANLGGQMGVFASAVFRTTDGGKQWDQVMLNSAAPSEQSTQGSFPPCPISRLAFLDAAHGWATGTCFIPKPTLYMTRDGGYTWRFQTIPLPADVPRSEAAWQGAAWSWPPVFVSPNNGVMLVGQVPGPHSLIVYTTADGGQTWQPHKIDANSFHPLGPPDFVDVHTGWFVSGSLSSAELQLFVTHDGGQTWAGVKSNTAPGVSVDFINDQIGWSWSPDGLLLETDDAGTTWNPIHPQLITP